VSSVFALPPFAREGGILPPVDVDAVQRRSHAERADPNGRSTHSTHTLRCLKHSSGEAGLKPDTPPPFPSRATFCQPARFVKRGVRRVLELASS